MATHLPSLLDDLEPQNAAARGKPGKPGRAGHPGSGGKAGPAAHPPRPSLPQCLRANLRARLARLKTNPARYRRFLLASRGLLALAAIGLVLTLYLIFRPVPKPDYDTAPMDEIFNYTLLTDEFNKLPIEERVKLVGQIVQRIKSMSGSDSALLAAFAAGIMGQARAQLEENISHLAVDLWDQYARDYATVPDSQRTQYLERTALEFVRTMEGIAGDVNTRPDEERLEEFRAQAKRDAEAARQPGRVASGRQVNRMFNVMSDGLGQTASPAQRQRGAQLLRDITRHFRGESLDNGRR